MFKSLKKSLTFRLIASMVNLCFMMSFMAPVSFAQSPADLGMPKPGTMIGLTDAYVPVIAKGLRVHPENPILFDFLIDTGNSGLKASDSNLKEESAKLVKYFLASLTTPEKDLWVNLSPYEKDRIIEDQLGQTEMGRDMLAQDYVLKQLTASLIYPEKEVGQKFWSKVYEKAQTLYGSSEIPVNTFNKVWIVADKAKIYVHENTAFVVASHLKVMLEEDYLSMTKHEQTGVAKTTNNIGSQIVREIVLPELEKEVNEGKNFANLRQIFNSMILATWYKKNLKESLLNQVYANKSKVSGVDVNDKTIKDQIYQEYLKAYKKGVFNYIKEDIQNGKATPKKYFSGGIVGDMSLTVTQDSQDQDVQRTIGRGPDGAMVAVTVATPKDQAADDKAMTSQVKAAIDETRKIGDFSKTIEISDREKWEITSSGIALEKMSGPAVEKLLNLLSTGYEVKPLEKTKNRIGFSDLVKGQSPTGVKYSGIQWGNTRTKNGPSERNPLFYGKVLFLPAANGLYLEKFGSQYYGGDGPAGNYIWSQNERGIMVLPEGVFTYKDESGDPPVYAAEQGLEVPSIFLRNKGSKIAKLSKPGIFIRAYSLVHLQRKVSFKANGKKDVNSVTGQSSDKRKQVVADEFSQKEKPQNIIEIIFPGEKNTIHLQVFNEDYDNELRWDMHALNDAAMTAFSASIVDLIMEKILLSDRNITVDEINALVAQSSDRSDFERKLAQSVDLDPNYVQYLMTDVYAAILESFINENIADAKAGKAADILIKPDATSEEGDRIISFLKERYDVRVLETPIALSLAQVNSWYAEVFTRLSSIPGKEGDIAAVRYNMTKPVRVLVVREKDGSVIDFSKLDTAKKEVRALLGVQKTDSLNKVHMADSPSNSFREMNILKGIMPDAAMTADIEFEGAQSATIMDRLAAIELKDEFISKLAFEIAEKTGKTVKKLVNTPEGGSITFADGAGLTYRIDPVNHHFKVEASEQKLIDPIKEILEHFVYDDMRLADNGYDHRVNLRSVLADIEAAKAGTAKTADYNSQVAEAKAFLKDADAAPEVFVITGDETFGIANVIENGIRRIYVQSGFLQRIRDTKNNPNDMLTRIFIYALAKGSHEQKMAQTFDYMLGKYGQAEMAARLNADYVRFGDALINQLIPAGQRNEEKAQEIIKRFKQHVWNLAAQRMDGDTRRVTARTNPNSPALGTAAEDQGDARMVYFALAANPFHYGQMETLLRSMVESKADLGIFRTHGFDFRKDVTGATVLERHAMMEEFVKFIQKEGQGILTTTDIGKENDKDGETDFINFIKLNANRANGKLRVFYLVGSDHGHIYAPNYDKQKKEGVYESKKMPDGKPQLDTIKKFDNFAAEQSEWLAQNNVAFAVLLNERDPKESQLMPEEVDLVRAVRAERGEGFIILMRGMNLEGASSTSIRNALAGVGNLEDLTILPTFVSNAIQGKNNAAFASHPDAAKLNFDRYRGFIIELPASIKRLAKAAQGRLPAEDEPKIANDKKVLSNWLVTTRENRGTVTSQDIYQMFYLDLIPRLKEADKNPLTVDIIEQALTQIDKAQLSQQVDKASVAQNIQGGIDLNANNMVFDVTGEAIKMNFDPAMLEQFKKGDFSGVRPVILNIAPVPSLLPVLGLKEADVKLAKV